VIVYCREHGRVRCIVERVPVTDIVRLRYHSPQLKNRHVEIIGTYDNVTRNLTDWPRPTVDAGGCERCGLREFPVADLLLAFEEGRSKLSL
jgi:hypothetical protein